ncbi:hypothetical protein [Shimia biformata]|uniref:hypothetical protein n=1 Tax=Shimia biformata TaxID=1294299 RepID=UPI00194ED091|nr:hypothetical protein [Shimia biformata]
MSRKFIAAILAASVTVTALNARPAHALSEDQLGALIFGGATLLIIGNAIKNKKNDPEPVVTRRTNRDWDHRHRDRNWDHRHGDRDWNNRNSHDGKAPRHDARALPRDCMRVHRVRGEDVYMVGDRCLARNYRNYNRLPRSCRVGTQTNRGYRQGFNPHCLRRNGYTLSRR